MTPPSLPFADDRPLNPSERAEADRLAERAGAASGAGVGWRERPGSEDFKLTLNWAINFLDDQNALLIWRDALARAPDARFLLDEIALSRFGGDVQWPPLILAASRGHQRLALWMLERGANPNAKTVESCEATGTSVFELALRSGLREFATALVRAPRFDIWACDEWGRPALNFLGHYNGPDKTQTFERLVGELLLRGADLERQDVDGDTPLHSASALDEIKLCQALLDRGANPGALNKANLAPDDISQSPAVARLISNWRQTLQERADLSKATGSPQAKAQKRGL